MNPFALVGSLVILGISAIALIRAHAQVDDRFVDRWAKAHALELTPDNRPMVAWYLRTARQLRTWGAIGGLILPSLGALAFGGPLWIVMISTNGDGSPGGLGWIFIGYLIGALYAEVSLVRPVDPARRSASLVPRELTDYLPRRLLLAQRGLAAFAVAGALLLGVVPFSDPSVSPSWPVVLATVAVVAGFAAGLERLQRWLVRRPQPFTSPSLVAADDAIRSQSVHSLAGSGLAVLLLMCSIVSLVLATSAVTVLRFTMWLPAMVGFVLSLVACEQFGHRPWPVRRSAAGPTRAASA